MRGKGVWRRGQRMEQEDDRVFRDGLGYLGITGWRKLAKAFWLSVVSQMAINILITFFNVRCVLLLSATDLW